MRDEDEQNLVQFGHVLLQSKELPGEVIYGKLRSHGNTLTPTRKWKARWSKLLSRSKRSKSSNQGKSTTLSIFFSFSGAANLLSAESRSHRQYLPVVTPEYCLPNAIFKPTMVVQQCWNGCSASSVRKTACKSEYGDVALRML